jgi:hypothetical protein
MKKTVFDIVPEKKLQARRNPNDTVCDLKWNYPIFNMDRGEFRSCCRTPSNTVTEEDLQSHGINAFSNSPREKLSRLNLINGIRDNDCQSCWNLEDRGIKSPRHTPERFHTYMQQQNVVPKNEEYDKDKLVEYLSSIKDIEHPALTSNTPYMMEISLGNTCDLKCMYCSHHYSTQWATERIKYGDITQEQYDREFPKAAPSFDAKFWEWFNRVGRFNLLRLGIIGGEPLIMPEFYEFVNKLISSIEPINRFRTEKMTFWIVTNLNTPPNYLEKLFNYLPKLTEVFNVEILVSMESIGPKAEYIRNGLNWKKFTNNLSMLLSRQDLTFDFGFIMSLNALNITSIQDFIKFTEDLYTKYQRPVSLKQNIVSFPSCHSPMILTPDFADYLDSTVEYMKTRVDSMPIVPDYYGRYDQYILYLEKLANSIRNNKGCNNKDRKSFVTWFATYDERRKLNFLEVFPEYKDFYEICNRC